MSRRMRAKRECWPLVSNCLGFVRDEVAAGGLCFGGCHCACLLFYSGWPANSGQRRRRGQMIPRGSDTPTPKVEFQFKPFLRRRDLAISRLLSPTHSHRPHTLRNNRLLLSQRSHHSTHNQHSANHHGPSSQFSSRLSLLPNVGSHGRIRLRLGRPPAPQR